MACSLTAVAVLSTSLCSDAGEVVWACGVGLHGLCALMWQLLVRCVSGPAWGATVL